MIPRVLIVAFCFLTASLFGAQSLFDEALRLSRTKNYKSALPLWEKLASQSPQTALYWFNLGNSQFLLKKYRASLKSYARARGLKTALRPAATLYEAKALRHLKRTREAKNLVDKLRSDTLPIYLATEVELEWTHLTQKNLRKAVHSYFAGKYDKAEALSRTQGDRASFLIGLSRLQRGQEALAQTAIDKAISMTKDTGLRNYLVRLKEKVSNKTLAASTPLSLELESAFGYSNNVGREASAANAIESPILQIGFNAGYELLSKDEFSLQLNYEGSWEEVWLESDFRFVGQGLSADLTYAPSEGSRARLSPVFQYSILGTDPLLYQGGGRMEIEQSFGERAVVFATEIVGNAAPSSTYAYLRGHQMTARLGFQQTWKKWQLFAGHSYYLQNIGNLPVTGGSVPLGFRGHGPQVTVSFRPTSAWEVGLRQEICWKSFLQQESPSGQVRDDLFFVSRATGKTRLSTELEAFAEIELSLNRSSLGATSLLDQNFTQVSTRIGVTWAIL